MTPSARRSAAGGTALAADAVQTATDIAALKSGQTYITEKLDELSCLIKEQNAGVQQTVKSLETRVSQSETSIALLNKSITDLAMNLTAQLQATKENRVACRADIFDSIRKDNDVLENGIEEMRTDQDKMEQRLKKVEELAPAIKAVTYVGALLVTSIIALIWALITGQAQLSF